jgi:HTH-type transcriptional regulator / antitoxin HipB
MNKSPAREQRLTTPLQTGEILRRRRKARGLPQRELAAKLGVSQGRFSSLESDPSGLSLARLLVLAQKLGLELVLRERSETKTNNEW